MWPWVVPILQRSLSRGGQGVPFYVYRIAPPNWKGRLISHVLTLLHFPWFCFSAEGRGIASSCRRSVPHLKCYTEKRSWPRVKDKVTKHGNEHWKRPHQAVTRSFKAHCAIDSEGKDREVRVRVSRVSSHKGLNEKPFSFQIWMRFL